MLVVLLCACTTETIYIVEDDITPKTGDSVRVEFLFPGVYSFGNLTSTRADDDNCGLPSVDDRLKNGLKTIDLEEGASLWLLYQVKDKEGNFGDPVLGGYKVVHNANGYSVFSPCKIVKDEKDDHLYLLNEDEEDKPLYITVGKTYRFLLISPALDLTYDVDNKKYTAAIKNGIYFASTDSRYHETQANEQEIEDNVDQNGIHFVQLNPIVEQTARIKLTVKAGDGVFDMKIMDSGVEVSGLQNAYEKKDDGTHETYYWSMEKEDSLAMHLGDKNTRVIIPKSDFTESETNDGKKVLTGDVGILPTDIMSTCMYILVNLEVNGVPTQYVTQLSNMRLYHGRSYNITLTTSIQDGVSVATWYNESWSEDLTPIEE